MPTLKEEFDSLVQAKRYGDAIALIEKRNPPNADKVITKLRARMGTEADVRMPAPRAAQSPYIVWFAAGVAATVIIFMLFQVPAVRNLITNLYGRLHTVCIYQGIDRGYDTSLEPGEMTKGCNLAVPYAMEFYAQEIQSCVDTQGQTNFTLQDCLEERGVYFDAKYELERTR